MSSWKLICKSEQPPLEFVLTGLIGGSTRQALELCIEEESGIPAPYRLFIGEKPYQNEVLGKLSWHLSRMKFYNGAVVYFKPEKEQVLALTRQTSVEKKLIDLDIVIIPDPEDQEKKLYMLPKREDGEVKQEETKKLDPTDPASWYDIKSQQDRLLGILHNLDSRTKFLEKQNSDDRLEQLMINEFFQWDELARLQTKILDKLYHLDERLEKERLATTSEGVESKTRFKSVHATRGLPPRSERKDEWQELENLQEGVIKKAKDLEVRLENERISGLSPAELAEEKKKKVVHALDSRVSVLDDRKSVLDKRVSVLDKRVSEEEVEEKEAKEQIVDLLDDTQSVLDTRPRVLDPSSSTLDPRGEVKTRAPVSVSREFKVPAKVELDNSQTVLDSRHSILDNRTSHLREKKKSKENPLVRVESEDDVHKDQLSFSTSEGKLEPVHVISDYFDLKDGASEKDSVQDVGNIVWFEHINLNVPDSHWADLFYGDCLGFTRDPYKVGSVDTTHFNVGRQQIHLPFEEDQPAQNSRGVLGVALRQDLFDKFKDNFAKALKRAEKSLKESDVSFTEHKWEDFPFKSTFAQYQGKAPVYYEVNCPWGNRFRIHPASPSLNASLGLVYIQLRCLHNSAKYIARFYHELLGATVRLREEKDVEIASVSIGPGQNLVFVEIPKNETQQLDQYDGHHICIYIANFSQTFKRLQNRKLIYVNKRFDDRAKTMEEALHYRCFRIKDIVMVEGRGRLFQLEHEIRSVVHPCYLKPLVNRADNPLLSS